MPIYNLIRVISSRTADLMNLLSAEVRERLNAYTCGPKTIPGHNMLSLVIKLCGQGEGAEWKRRADYEFVE